CHALLNMRLYDLRKCVREACTLAAARAPAVIVLDDLHAVTPKPGEGPAAGTYCLCVFVVFYGSVWAVAPVLQ
ncbi:MAG: hypothetical protein P4L40_13750, partial [Terracidiphilus sp.]|nr:hypothetical protein [Terracidiphilus sp.]